MRVTSDEMISALLGTAETIFTEQHPVRFENKKLLASSCSCTSKKRRSSLEENWSVLQGYNTFNRKEERIA